MEKEMGIATVLGMENCMYYGTLKSNSQTKQGLAEFSFLKLMFGLSFLGMFLEITSTHYGPQPLDVPYKPEDRFQL